MNTTTAVLGLGVVAVLGIGYVAFLRKPPLEIQQILGGVTGNEKLDGKSFSLPDIQNKGGFIIHAAVKNNTDAEMDVETFVSLTGPEGSVPFYKAETEYLPTLPPGKGGWITLAIQAEHLTPGQYSFYAMATSVGHLTEARASFTVI